MGEISESKIAENSGMRAIRHRSSRKKKIVSLGN
jgi:hypothetical protein